tara:strand:+ start:14571 stop:14900 length:330 start_codon:yes stop_codon:yes gene_type:complete
VPVLESGGIYLAECEGKAVGFGHAENGEIHAVFVDPDWVGKGVGRRLLQRGIDGISAEGAGQVFLKATLNAVGFYRTFGFIETGPTSFDCNGVDIPAIRMTLQSPSSQP